MLMESATKNELIEWIFNPSNEELLHVLKLIKENADGTDWHNNLSEAEKISLENGISDHESGNTLSSEEFWGKIR